MKRLKQTIAVLMVVTLLILSLPVSANAKQDFYADEEFSGYGKGDLSLAAENNDNPTVISSVSDYYKLINKNQSVSKDIAQTKAEALPASVDNSASPYFPEISSQGSLNSCVPFSCTYYQFTYEINRSRGVKTTADNTFSPKWAFNFLNHGSNSGTDYESVYGIFKQHGCPTLKSLPYDAKDYLSWSTDEKVWREAMRYRLEDYQLFDRIGVEGTEITSPDDADLIPIKTALANGDILTFSTFMDSVEKGKNKIKTNPAAPENDKYVNEQYLRELPGSKGGHRMTIVGYNDKLWCDINENDKVDAGEMGAFKIANSWGKNYANNGYLWFSYDSLNHDSCVDGIKINPDRYHAMMEITRISVRVNEGKDIYVRFTANTANRSRFYTVFQATLHGTEYSRYMLDEARYVGTSDYNAFDGTKNACDATFVYPLDDLAANLTTENFEDFNFFVTFKDSPSEPSTVTIKNASLVNEYTGKEYKVNANYPITLNGNDWKTTLKERSTKNAVIYYIGFDEPNLHYKESDGSFKKVKMERNDERHGYQYKYVIEDIKSDLTVYFSDDSGKIDNNSGSYFSAKDGLNYYFTEGQCEKLEIVDLKVSNGTPDIGKRVNLDFETTGGYAPYKYKYTIEDLSTGTTKTVNYTGIYANNPFKYEKETTYKITVEAMDYAKQITQSSIIVTVEDQPFVISSVTPNKANSLVSKEMTFTSVTEFEGLLSGPHKPESHFVIKDKDGKVWCDEIVKYTSANYSINSTTTMLNFTPQKAGEYTLTVDSTDYNKDYAEKTVNFTVYDMIYGDADGNGVINIKDATTIQLYLVSLVEKDDIHSDLADSDANENVTILDATTIQLYLAKKGDNYRVGEVVEYTPVIEPTQKPTTPTVAPTQKPTTAPAGDTVTFTNSLKWSGTIYCYYWSDSNTSMTTWPGKAMTKSGVNEYGETLYTFKVPSGAKNLIFTNGSEQTVDISYPGGEVKYYAQSSKTGNGYNVGTW